MLFTGAADQLIFFQGQRQRFLAKNMFASFQCLNGNLDMPVVRRDDTNNINIIPFQNFSIVTVRIRLTFANTTIFLGSFSVPGIDITNCQDVAKSGVPTGITRTHATHAHAANSGSVVLRLVGKCFFCPGKVRDRSGGCHCR